jgi:hypothetical protein
MQIFFVANRLPIIGIFSQTISPASPALFVATAGAEEATPSAFSGAPIIVAETIARPTFERAFIGLPPQNDSAL